MDLGGAVGAFDFDMFRVHGDRFLVAQGRLVLPPDKTATDHRDQQQQADDAQNSVGNANRLLDATQAVHIAALGIGTGELIELLDQEGLVHAEQFGIGADVAPGKGMPWQLVERAVFQIAQGSHGEIELDGHFGQRPTIAFAGLTQGLTGVYASRCYNFRMRRFHHCSDRYC